MTVGEGVFLQVPCGQNNNLVPLAGATPSAQHCALFPRVPGGRQQPQRGSGALGGGCLSPRLHAVLSCWCFPAVCAGPVRHRLKK